MINISAVLIGDLQDAGLLVAEPHPAIVTDWFNQADGQTVSETVIEDWAADLVLSVNAISR